MAGENSGGREKQVEQCMRMVKAIAESAIQTEQGARSSITSQQIANLLLLVEPIFTQEPMLVEVAAPVTMCGDIHGQVNDLVRLLDTAKWPPETRFLFLGDYVDRGPQNVDTIVLMFALKFLYPDSFYMIRGNHETKAVNAVYGFKEELQQRYPATPGPDGKPIDHAKNLWQSFNRVFGYMPLAALVQGRILCMHGGLSPSLTSLDQIRQLKRPMTKFPDKGLEIDLLWADPDKNAKVCGQCPRCVIHVR